jgi:PAS domain S-box-containing protein
MTQKPKPEASFYELGDVPVSDGQEKPVAYENLDGLRLEHLYREGTTSLFVGVVGAFVATVVLWEDIAHGLLVAWNLGYLALCAIRYVLREAYLRTPTSLGSVSLWRSRFVVAQATGSFFWALAAIVLFPTENYLKQGFVSLLVAGISVGTTHTCAADKRAQLAFTVIVIPAFIARNLYEGTPWNLSIAAVIGFAALFSLWWANRERATLDDYLTQKLDRSMLLSSLLQEQSRIGQLNEDLESRIRESKDLERRLAASESRYRQTVEHSPNAILTLDSDGQVISWNPSFERILGYEPTQIAHMPFSKEVLNSKDSHQFQEMLEGVFQGRSFSGLELTFRCKNGTLKHMISRAYPLKDSVGQVAECTLASTDVTLQKQSEQRIVSSLREKEVLLQEIHHRVKNNLQMMASLLELQSGYLDDERVKDACLDSERRIWSMALVHEALYRSHDFSHIRSRPYLESLIQEVWTSFRGCDAEVVLSTDVEDVELTADTAINSGLIVNELLSNSLKHAFSEKGEGEVSVTLSSSDDGHFELRIADNGKGICPEAISAKGKSFGLDLVRMLVEEMRGDLNLASDGGTGFRIRWKKPEQEKGVVPHV